MKKYLEKRAEKLAAMNSLLDGAKVETRALTDEEVAKIEDLKAEIEAIDKTIEAIKAAAAADVAAAEEKAADGKAEDVEAEECRAFADYVRGVSSRIETRDTLTGVGTENAGGIVPTTIAKRIIDKVKDICPILSKAHVYNVNGNISIPYVSEEGSDAEFEIVGDLATIKQGNINIKTIDLQNAIAGVIIPISKTLINATDIDIVNQVVEILARKMANYVDASVFKGNAKVDGLCLATNTIQTQAQGIISVDDLINLTGKIPSAYKANACFCMNPVTLTAIKSLKDGNGRPLFTTDLTSEMQDRLLGYPVYTSENISGKPGSAIDNQKLVYFGDLYGLAVKMPADLEIEILREAYAANYAIGVAATLNFNAKIENEQMIAVLTNKAVLGG